MRRFIRPWWALASLTVSLCVAFALAGVSTGAPSAADPSAAADLAAAGAPSAPGDWPQWRGGPARGGTTAAALPADPRLSWVIDLPAPSPAWPVAQTRLRFDRLYDPVASGGLLFVPSMVSDSVTAYRISDGREEWTFFADGPVRFAPAIWKGRVLFASDDGFLYALDAASGKLHWRLRGGPSDRRLLGNDRLISAWPARGAPVVADGRVWFAAGIWPFMGVFIHCLDIESGEVVWTQSGNGSSWTEQQHFTSAFAGVAPQGYLALSGRYLLVAGGRTVPAAFDRDTGELIHFVPGSRDMGSKGGGGYSVVAGRDFFVNRGDLYRLSDGKFLTHVSAGIVSPRAMLEASGGGITAYRPGWKEVVQKDRQGKETRKVALEKLWSAKLDPPPRRLFLRAGDRVYGAADGNRLVAIDLPAADRPARVAWDRKLPAEPLDAIAASGHLVVATSSGDLYGFGAGRKAAPPPARAMARLVSRGAVWRYRDERSPPAEEWSGEEFDDSAWKEGPTQLGYGDGDEATVLAFGSDPKRKPITTWFRHRFSVPPASAGAPARLRLLADDGAAVYLNGAEVARVNLPRGPLTPRTRASRVAVEDRFVEVRLSPERLRAGVNTLAVEVHQVRPSSSDVSFDLELLAEGTELPARIERPRDAASERAEAILAASGRREGHCVVLGLAGGALAEELARQSRLRVVVLERDAAAVERFRRRHRRERTYGERLAAVVAPPVPDTLPEYLADLVVVPGEPERADRRDDALRGLYRILRPFTGTLCLRAGAKEAAALRGRIAALALDGARVEARGALVLLRRARAPAGSGEWTHQNGDAANSVSSHDERVRLPLGVLWFGGPPNDGVLPRHGHGPTPEVAGGRLVIEGRHMLRAVDIYTGRLLWERRLPDIGIHYDSTIHEPGANAIGSNYVTLADAIYAVHRDRCLKLDPATGETAATFELPREAATGRPGGIGAIAVRGDTLLLGARPTLFDPPDFTKKELASLKGEELMRKVAVVGTWKGLEPPPRPKGTDDHAWLTASANRLLLDPAFLERIPSAVLEKPAVRAIARRLAAHLAEERSAGGEDRESLLLKRELLAVAYRFPRFRPSVAGRFGSVALSASHGLVALDRRRGSLKWSYRAERLVRHNAIAAGKDRVFLIDRWLDAQIARLERRGRKPDRSGRVVALDLEDGREIWSSSTRVFGTWLGYSVEHDVLLEAGSKGRDRLADEVGKGMTAYRGRDGAVLWRSGAAYSGPCVLLGRTIYTQVVSSTSPGTAFDLLTGEPRTVRHPLTGGRVPWRYQRGHGCNNAIGAPHLLTFRSAAAAYFDLDSNAGTGNFGGFRSGCTSTLIAAGGILNAPDYTRTCTCAYQNQTSLALVPMDDVELWSFSALGAPKGAVERLGLNFAAPGDRAGPGGTLWIDWPSRGGASPDPEARTVSGSFRFVRYHSSRIRDGALPWVAASAIEGAGELAVRLGPAPAPAEAAGGTSTPVPEPARFTVRLVFAEIEDLAAGERVFDVHLGGSKVLDSFDIAREAGGPRRSLVRELTVEVPSGGELRIGLVGRSGRPPLLAGIEVVRRESAEPSPRTRL